MAILLLGTTIGGYAAIHAGNIGSQSVNYANSSGSTTGNAATVTSITGNTGLLRDRLAASAFIDGLTSANFRTTLFGSTTQGYQISTARWNNVPGPLTGINAYGTMIAWAGADTHSFIAVDYNTAGAIIGGGSGDLINWSKKLAFADGTGASGTWGINVTGSAGSVEGIVSSRITYGDNASGSTSITNALLDTAIRSGFYTVGTGGIPNATAVNFVLHTAYASAGNTAGFDLAANDSTTSQFYLRPATGAGKGAWQTILTSANYTSYAVPTTRSITINGVTQDLSANRTFTVGGSDSTKLPLAGGTMSGAIVLDSISGVNQTVANTYGAYLHLGAWGVARTAYNAVLVNTAWRADALWDMNISQFTNNSGYITSSSLSAYLPLTGVTLTGTLIGTYIRARATQTIGNYTTAALWTESYDNSTTGIAFHISGVVGKFLEMRTNGILYWEGTQVVTNAGTWGINVSGNAATVSNGVYTNVTNTIVNGDAAALIVYGGSSYNAAAALHIGGWSTDTTYARIRTSNGNLHIDTRGGAGNVYQMYFNHYSSGDMYFGNGGGTVYIYGGRLRHSDGTPYITNSGTWGISTTGNAATATYATTAGSANQIDGWDFTNTGSNSATSPDTINSNGISYTSVTLLGQTDGALYSQAYNSNWQHQVFGDYRTGQIAVRGKNSGTWQSWRTILDSSNYNSYSPTLTGGGASGTWGINITGSSGSTTYALNSTRLYASDSPYTYGGAAPYYMAMTYDGSRWLLQVTPGTPSAVRVAYADSAGSASSASTASQVTINYNDNSNANYQLLWGSGNSVYGTGDVYVNPSSDVINARGGFISTSNPWSTANSAFFPNGITTAGNDNWIYGHTYVGNAPGNGAGHEFWSNGSSYHRSNLGTSSHGASARFIELQSAAGNFIPYSFESDRGNHSWGTVARYRINNGESDRPSLQFSWGGSDNRWNVGYCLNDDNFRITQNMGYRNDNSTSDGWGTERFRVNTDGTTHLGIQGSTTTAYGAVRLASNNNLYLDNNYGQSIVGVYSSTVYQGIWAMGDSYKLPINGSTTGSLYGLAWSHPNAGGVAGNLNTHGLLVMENGTFLAAISGSIRARDDMRAPAMYTYNMYTTSGSYINFQNSIHLQGNSVDYVGSLYFSGAGHIQPNSGSYGALQMTSSKNGWSGIRFTDSENNLMMNSNESGHHRNGYGWQFRWYNGSMYVSTNAQGGGSEGTVWHSINAPRASNSHLMYYQGFTLDANTMDVNSTGFTYSVNAPFTGPIARFSTGGGYDLWIGGNYSGGGNSFHVRTRNGDAGAMNPWRELITSGNIGSQSVNYASSSGSASYASTAGSLASMNISQFSNNSGYITSGSNVVGLYSSGWGNGNFTWYQTPGGLAPYGGSWASFLVSNHGDGSNYYNQTIIMPFWGAPQYSRREGGNNRGPWSFWTEENLNPNSISGNFYASGTITAGSDVIAYSDARIKTNIQTINNALEKVLSLRGVTYMRTDSDDTREKIGVIAQEVQKVLPQVVFEQSNGILGVSYGNMIGVLIEAIKEQQKEIDGLKAKLN